MTHAIRYQGRFEPNFSRLRPGTSDYIRPDGSIGTLRDWPKSANGIRFGYMELPEKEFVAVRVQFAELDLVPQVPVKLNRARHLGGRGLGPNPTTIDDEAASHLIADFATANPSLAATLTRIQERGLGRAS